MSTLRLTRVGLQCVVSKEQRRRGLATASSTHTCSTRRILRRGSHCTAVSASKNTGSSSTPLRSGRDEAEEEDEVEEEVWDEKVLGEDGEFMTDAEIEAALIELEREEAVAEAAAAAAAAAKTKAGKLDDVDVGNWEDQEWDEDELDELFEKYGKTIKDDEGNQADMDQSTIQPTTAATVNGKKVEEVEVDGEELALVLATAASDTKGGDILVLDVRRLVYWTQFFVIATAYSRPQMDAMARRLRDTVEERYNRLPSGGNRASGSGAASSGGGGVSAWTLLDYGDVVVHLFSPKERETYRLEDFYANAEMLPLPFEQQPQQQFR